MDVKIPNNEYKGDRRDGSFPLAGSPSQVNPPNGPSDRRNGSFPLTGGGSPIDPPTDGLRHNLSISVSMPENRPADKEGARLVNPGLGANSMPAWVMKGR
jgi:hypothetical protein